MEQCNERKNDLYDDIPKEIPDFEVTMKGPILIFLKENKGIVERLQINFKNPLTIYAAQKLGYTIKDCILLPKRKFISNKTDLKGILAYKHHRRQVYRALSAIYKEMYSIENKNKKIDILIPKIDLQKIMSEIQNAKMDSPRIQNRRNSIFFSKDHESIRNFNFNFNLNLKNKKKNLSVKTIKFDLPNQDEIQKPINLSRLRALKFQQKFEKNKEKLSKEIIARKNYRDLWNNPIKDDNQNYEKNKKMKSFYRIVKQADKIDNKLLVNSQKNKEMFEQLENEIEDYMSNRNKYRNKSNKKKEINYSYNKKNYEGTLPTIPLKVNKKKSAEDMLNIGQIPTKVTNLYEISPYIRHTSLIDIDKNNSNNTNRKTKKTFNCNKVKETNKLYSYQNRVSAQSEVFNEAQKMNFERIKRIRMYKELVLLNKYIEKQTRTEKKRNPGSVPARIHETLKENIKNLLFNPSKIFIIKSKT